MIIVDRIAIMASRRGLSTRFPTGRGPNALARSEARETSPDDSGLLYG